MTAPTGYDMPYAEAVDNCTPRCGPQRVLFRWLGVDQAACPACFRVMFAGPASDAGDEPSPDMPVITLPVAGVS